MSMKGKGGKGGKAKGGGKTTSAGESIALTKTKARATTSINVRNAHQQCHSCTHPRPPEEPFRPTIPLENRTPS